MLALAGISVCPIPCQEPSSLFITLLSLYKNPSSKSLRRHHPNLVTRQVTAQGTQSRETPSDPEAQESHKTDKSPPTTSSHMLGNDCMGWCRWEGTWERLLTGRQTYRCAGHHTLEGESRIAPDVIAMGEEIRRQEERLV